ncbi:Hypothetical_protein [Hexamita inflata]|uniref:Hypothetical_protein n=1 Tax=Hexamita inflata TaxID=28002 RepID=A0ABP1H468_9EUKA
MFSVYRPLNFRDTLTWQLSQLNSKMHHENEVKLVHIWFRRQANTYTASQFIIVWQQHYAMILIESNFRNNQLCEVQQRVQLVPQSEQARFRYATQVLLFNYYGKLVVIQKLPCKHIYFQCQF